MKLPACSSFSVIRHCINIDSRFPINRMEVADGLRPFGRDLVGEVFDGALFEHAAIELSEARRHAELRKECNLAADALFRLGLVVAEVGGHIPDFFGEMCEARSVVMVDVLGPRAPDGRQALAVRCVEFRAERMAELVAREILAAAELGEVAVRDAAAPHNLTHGVVAALVFDGDAGALHDVLEERLGDEVGELVAGEFREIALERVHEDVADACSELLFRHGIRELRVHERERRTVERRVDAALDAHFLVRQHGAVARLAARGRERQHDGDRRRLRELRTAAPEIPDVRLRIRDAVGDGLRRVDDGAAADGEDEVGAERDGLAHAVARMGDERVRLDAAAHGERDAALGQHALDARQQARTHDGAAAVDDEDMAAAVLLDLLADLELGVLAEDDVRRAFEREVLHVSMSSLYYKISNRNGMALSCKAPSLRGLSSEARLGE